MKIGAILSLIAVFNLALYPIPLTGGDLGAFLLELTVGAGAGVLQARVAHFRPITPGAANRLLARSSIRGREVPQLESRPGGTGLLIWVCLLAVRVGIGAYAAAHGLELVTSVWAIYLVIGANRIANGAILSRRTVAQSVSA